MKRILMVTVATIILLRSTTTITAFASALQTRTFRTNLVKGEYVDEEVLEPEESIDEELIDVAEEIITDLAKIAGSQQPVDEQESQVSDGHTDASTPADIEPIVDKEAGELEEPIETDITEPDETIEEYIGETEEEHETEVQSTQ